MKIAMGNDHAGLPMKLEIKAYLESQGHEVLDFGTHTSDAADLADYIYPASLAVAKGEADRGIFVDGVGFGSAMIANKLPGVYACCCQDPYSAKLARWHCDSNVLCLGGKIIGSVIAMEIVKDWMAAEYWGDQEKYARRVGKVAAIDERHIKRLDDKACSNTNPCVCPHGDCARHGRCCECVAFHRDEMGGLPNCFKKAGIEAVKKD